MDIHMLIKNSENLLRRKLFKNNFIGNIFILIILIVILLLFIKFNVREEFSPYISSGDDIKPEIFNDSILEKIQNTLNKNVEFPINYNNEFRKLDRNDITINKNNLSKNLKDTISEITDAKIKIEYIYDIYINPKKEEQIIYSVVILIINEKLGIAQRHFLQVYVNVLASSIEILKIINDLSKRLDVKEYNVSQSSDKEKSVSEDIYEKEIVKIKNELISLNKSAKLPDYKKEYLRFPFNTKFELNNVIKEKIIADISAVLKGKVEYKDEQIYSLRDLYDIYYIDLSFDRYYIANMDIFLKSKAVTIPLTVYIKIRNVTRFLDLGNRFLSDVGALIKSEDIELLYIEIVKQEKDIGVILASQEPSIKDYYTLENRFGLFYPFQLTEKDMRITDEMNQDFQRKVVRTSIKDLGFCYDTDTTSGLSKYTTKQECETNGGLWDYPPEIDDECPFYKMNTNYDNIFGKIKGNSCELPRNMRLIGHRYYSLSDNFRPLCYNCKDNLINNGTLGYCCEKQKDVNIYPELSSPDYAFNGDTAFRYQQSDKFISKNLSVE